MAIPEIASADFVSLATTREAIVIASEAWQSREAKF